MDQFLEQQAIVPHNAGIALNEIISVDAVWRNHFRKWFEFCRRFPGV